MLDKEGAIVKLQNNESVCEKYVFGAIAFSSYLIYGCPLLQNVLHCLA
jgi:hypothetical protein